MTEPRFTFDETAEQRGYVLKARGEYHLRPDGQETDSIKLTDAILYGMGGKRISGTSPQTSITYFLTDIPSAIVHSGRVIRIHSDSVENVEAVKSRLEELSGIKFEMPEETQ
jgi:hypothetical protein